MQHSPGDSRNVGLIEEPLYPPRVLGFDFSKPRLVLPHTVVRLTTARGGIPIGDIVSDGHGGIMLRSPEGARGGDIPLQIGVVTLIGIDTIGSRFFGNGASKISGKHFEIYPHTGEDGKLLMQLRNCSQSNGTSEQAIMMESERQVTMNPAGIAGSDGDCERADGDYRIISLAGRKYQNPDGTYRNEDTAYIDPEHGVVAVADGMGGQGSGDRVSKIIVHAVHNGVSSGKSSRQILHDAQANIASENFPLNPETGRPSNPGTTIAMVRQVRGADGRVESLECTHAGDSKIYIIDPAAPDARRGLIHVSKDQTRVQKMIDGGVLPPMARYDHPYNNIVQGGIFFKQPENPDLYSPPEIRRVPVRSGCVAIAVSDGISDFISPEEIFEMVKKYGKDAPPAIVTLATSRHNQAFDMQFEGKRQHVNLPSEDNLAIGMMMVR